MSTGGSASAISELYADGNNASALSSNSMSGYLNVTSAGTVSFAFDIDYDLQLFSTAGETGLSSFSFDLDLFDLANNSLLDGYSDASLFLGLGPDNGSMAGTTSGLIELELAAGSYRMDISMDQYVVSEVPVPAAVWLMGSGLMALIGFARRKA
jgi:hypothetical protein